MHYVDSYYSSTLSTDTARPALGAPMDTEVCVVGGGLAGLATALGLRERGADVVSPTTQFVLSGSQMMSRIGVGLKAFTGLRV